MYDYGYTYSYAAAGAAAGVVSSLISLAMSILALVAVWKIFVKAGEEGWKALIPFYNLYTLYKVCWKTKMFWIYLGCMLGGFLLGMIMVISGAIAENVALVPFGVLLMLAGTVTVLVLSIICNVKLAKAFGKSGGFAVGLVLLNYIFYCIMAFDKSITYVGPQGEKTV